MSKRPYIYNNNSPNIVIVPTVSFCCNSSFKKPKLENSQSCSTLETGSTSNPKVEHQNEKLPPKEISINNNNIKESNSSKNTDFNGKQHMTTKHVEDNKAVHCVKDIKAISKKHPCSWASNYLMSIGDKKPVRLNVTSRKMDGGNSDVVNTSNKTTASNVLESITDKTCLSKTLDFKNSNVQTLLSQPPISKPLILKKNTLNIKSAKFIKESKTISKQVFVNQKLENNCNINVSKTLSSDNTQTSTYDKTKQLQLKNDFNKSQDGINSHKKKHVTSSKSKDTKHSPLLPCTNKNKETVKSPKINPKIITNKNLVIKSNDMHDSISSRCTVNKMLTIIQKADNKSVSKKTSEQMKFSNDNSNQINAKYLKTSDSKEKCRVEFNETRHETKSNDKSKLNEKRKLGSSKYSLNSSDSKGNSAKKLREQQNSTTIKRVSTPVKSVVKVTDNFRIKKNVKRRDNKKFDLRTKLCHINKKDYISKSHDLKTVVNINKGYKVPKKKLDNLVVKIENEAEDHKDNSLTDNKTNSPKTVRYKQIKLVINFISQHSLPSSSESDNECYDNENDSTFSNADLSFLDDFNVDEIVDTLDNCKNDPNTDNQNAYMSVYLSNTEQASDFSNSKVIASKDNESHQNSVTSEESKRLEFIGKQNNNFENPSSIIERDTQQEYHPLLDCTVKIEMSDEKDAINNTTVCNFVMKNEMTSNEGVGQVMESKDSGNIKKTAKSQKAEQITASGFSKEGNEKHDDTTNYLQIQSNTNYASLTDSEDESKKQNGTPLVDNINVEPKDSFNTLGVCSPVMNLTENIQNNLPKDEVISNNFVNNTSIFDVTNKKVKLVKKQEERTNLSSKNKTLTSAVEKSNNLNTVENKTEDRNKSKNNNTASESRQTLNTTNSLAPILGNQISEAPTKENTNKDNSSPQSNCEIVTKVKDKVLVQEAKCYAISPSNCNATSNSIKDKTLNKPDIKKAIVTKTDIKPELKETEKNFAQEMEQRMFECLREQYTVLSLIHLGSFSKIYLCKDSKGGKFGLKVLNNEKKHYSAGISKQKMLLNLQHDIPMENFNCVYIFKGFTIKGQRCFLMEYYPKTLEQALKENTKSFHINQVQNLARQLVGAVTLLRNSNIVHSDIKPSHILVNSTNDKLKLCGFDRAYYIDTIINLMPTIGSVHYRAPEIILGFSAEFGIDVWSTALVIYEMATNRRLFPGKNNNDILYQQLCTLGDMPTQMIENSLYNYQYFVGPRFKRRFGYNGQNVVIINDIKKNTILRDSVYFAYKNNWMKTRTQQQVTQDMEKLRIFHKLLEQMLSLHPQYRLPIEFVYANPFLYDVTS